MDIWQPAFDAAARGELRDFVAPLSEAEIIALRRLLDWTNWSIKVAVPPPSDQDLRRG